MQIMSLKAHNNSLATYYYHSYVANKETCLTLFMLSVAEL